MRNFLLTLLSVLTIFCFSYFLPQLIGPHTDDPLLWELFFTGLYMGLAIVVLKINYFIQHYVRAILLIIVCGVCHYGAVWCALRIQSHIYNYINEQQLHFDYSSMSDPPHAEDYNIYAYSLANLIAISILILCLSFIVKFKKWFRLSIFGASIIMTLFMNLLITRLSQYSIEGEKEVVISTFVFAIWQCVVGTVIYRGVKEQKNHPILEVNPSI